LWLLKINLGIEGLSRFTWFFLLFSLFFGFILKYIFFQLLWDFPFVLKKKNMLPIVFFFFFLALFNLVFYEDFCFWIKYKHQMFFILCFNYLWDPGRLIPRVHWVMSQPVGSSILCIKWYILIFFNYSSFFLIWSLLIWFLFFFILLWICGLRNFQFSLSF